MAKSNLTAQLLREVLSYDPQTGVFIRIRNLAPWHARRYLGKVAGAEFANGYRYIGICGRGYYAHRLAWLYVTGKWPTYQIDHIDGDKRNNRFANLREVPLNGNNQNKRRAFVTSRVGLLGVVKHGRGFQARITYGEKTKCLGTFDTAEQAHDAYVAAKRKFHPFGTL